MASLTSKIEQATKVYNESYLKPSSSGMELDTLTGWEGLGGTGGFDGVVWVI